MFGMEEKQTNRVHVRPQEPEEICRGHINWDCQHAELGCALTGKSIVMLENADLENSKISGLSYDSASLRKHSRGP